MKPSFEDIMAYCALNRSTYESMKERFSMMVPFVGAGLSGFCYPTWMTVLKNLSRGLPNEKEIQEMLRQPSPNYFQIAQLIYETMGGALFYQKMQEEFDIEKFLQQKAADQSLTETQAVFDLPELFPNVPAITTNFDEVLETVYQDANHDFDVVVRSQEHDGIVPLRKGKRHGLYKVHGDFSSGGHVIFTQEQYDAAYRADSTLVKELSDWFSNKPFLFLGCSLNQDRVLDLFQAVTCQDHDISAAFAILSCPRERFDDRAAELQHYGIQPLFFEPKRYESLRVILRQLLRDTLMPPQPPIHRVNAVLPHGAIQRPPLLEKIRDTLEESGALVLSGMDGMGKTTLALQYQESLDASCNRIMITCSTLEIFRQELHQFLVETGFYSFDEKEPQEFGEQGTRDFLQKLESLKQYVLVFDDVQDDRVMQEIQRLRFSKKGTVLITTPQIFPQNLQGNIPLLAVESLTPEETDRLLQAQIALNGITKKSKAFKLSKKQLKQLTEYLDGIPAGISCAVSYLLQTGSSLPDYYDYLRKKRLTGRSGRFDVLADTVSGICRHLMQEEYAPTIRKLLIACTVLPLERIPLSLLKQLVDEEDFDDASASIQNVGLYRADNGQIQIPRIIQHGLRCCLAREELQACGESLMDLIYSRWEMVFRTHYGFREDTELFLLASALLNQPEDDRAFLLPKLSEYLLHLIIGEHSIQIGVLEAAQNHLTTCDPAEPEIPRMLRGCSAVLLAFLYEYRRDYDAGAKAVQAAKKLLTPEVSPVKWMQLLQYEIYLAIDCSELEQASLLIQSSLETLQTLKPVLEPTAFQYTLWYLINSMGHIAMEYGSYGEAADYYSQVCRAAEKSLSKAALKKCAPYLAAGFNEIYCIVVERNALNEEELARLMELSGWLKKTYPNQYNVKKADCFRQIGTCLTLIGRFQEAETFFVQSIQSYEMCGLKENVDFHWTYFFLTHATYQLGLKLLACERFEKGYHYLKEALHKHPEYKDLQDCLGTYKAYLESCINPVRTGNGLPSLVIP